MMSNYIAPANDFTGLPVNQRISGDGSLTLYTPQGAPGLFNVATYDATSKHNVPAVFDNWMKQGGTVLEGGRLVQDQLADPLSLLGRPITEAYWATISVNGQPSTVLLQLFERRALTYNPNNPPEWRVETANVGRSYFEWRYKSASPAPAISAEAMGSGIAVHGWNWPGRSLVRVEIVPASSPGTLAGPNVLQADASGRFASTLPYNSALQNALQASLPIEIRAQYGTLATALPLAGKPPSGKVHLEGTITLVETTRAGTKLVLSGLAGQQSRLLLAQNASITTSEGSAADAAMLDVGLSVIVEGEITQGVVNVGSIKLLSLSHSGARLDYEWNQNGALFVAGTGWPGEHSVTFSIGPSNAPHPPFATLVADSRGNLTSSIALPKAPVGQSMLWLFASSSDKNGLLAQVALPIVALGSTNSLSAAQLYITAKQGAEEGSVGSYCVQGKCFASNGVALLVDTLTVKPGDMLGLRAQSGTNPVLAPTATLLSTQLYLYPNSSAGSAYFVPGGSPIFETGDLPGHPFSITLPASLAPGRYALIVSVSWPDAGGKNNGVYGFAVQVP